MTKPILIVGGGPAGLAAAHSLGTVGRPSILVEKEGKLGGAPILSGYAKLVPTGEWAKDAIGGMVDRVEADSNVKVVTGATVNKFDGTPGNFTAELSNGDSVDVEAAVLCSGFTHFDSVNKPEWGFGTFEDVVTTTQVEQMISSGDGVRCPSDGRQPKRVAILLCVDALLFCCVLAHVTARLAESGVPRSVARSRQISQWKFAKSYPTAMFTSITWISAHSAFTKPSTTGAARKSSRSSTSRHVSPK
jgi:heterodisulfide reductase subunit A-like polyferredoxin